MNWNTHNVSALLHFSMYVNITQIEGHSSEEPLKEQS